MARVQEINALKEIDRILQSGKTDVEAVLLVSHVVMRHKEKNPELWK